MQNKPRGTGVCILALPAEPVDGRGMLVVPSHLAGLLWEHRCCSLGVGMAPRTRLARLPAAGDCSSPFHLPLCAGEGDGFLIKAFKEPPLSWEATPPQRLEQDPSPSLPLNPLYRCHHLPLGSSNGQGSPAPPQQLWHGGRRRCSVPALLMPHKQVVSLMMLLP